MLAERRHIKQNSALDGSSTGEYVPRMWALWPPIDQQFAVVRRSQMALSVISLRSD